MYCNHCAKKIDEKKVEAKKLETEQFFSKAKDTLYVCPRCGHLIKKGLNEVEVKELSAAAHAEVHTARNNLNRGKSGIAIGAILLAISFMFFLMSFKATAGGSLVTNCLEFFVFAILITLGLAVLIFGIVWIFIGFNRKKEYEGLLKEIQDETFVQ